MDRFWSKVDKKSENECWEWNRPYRFSLKNRKDQMTPHKASWILHFGDIEKGYLVCRNCINHKCVNPSHLVLKMQADINRELAQKNIKEIHKRFWEKVKILNKDECWEWQAAFRKDGYGVINVDGEIVGAHRVSYMLSKGEIAGRLLVCHKCDNRKCVNPNHLFLGTYSDNLIDSINKGRKIPNIDPKYLFKKGNKPSTRKLDDAKAAYLKNKINSGINVYSLSKEENIKPHILIAIKNGRTYKDC